MGSEKKLQIKILKTESQIEVASLELADKLNTIYEGKKVVWMTVMRGGIVFSVELMKKINFDIKLDFISSSSYEQYGKVGDPKIDYSSGVHLKNMDIILVDDIIDTGDTMEKIIEFLEKYHPKSITLIAMFHRKGYVNKNYKFHSLFEKRKDDFLIGYGLDVNSYYRNLPYIGIIKKNEN